MINPSFKELSKISPSRYEICVMIMQRARRLTDGSAPLVKGVGVKPCTIALEEIMAEKVVEKKPVAANEE